MTVEELLKLTWKELNVTLLQCHSEEELKSWLDAELLTGRRTRCKRILGRLSAVQREKLTQVKLPRRKKQWRRQAA